jgi:S1-C subfamily serine protease
MKRFLLFLVLFSISVSMMVITAVAHEFNWHELAMSGRVGSPSCTVVSYYADDSIHSDIVYEIKSGVAPRAAICLRLRRESVGGISSGVFISEEGYLLTNNHCIPIRGETARVLIIWTSEYEGSPIVMEATLYAFDAEGDLALLKVNNDSMKFPPAKLAGKNIGILEEGLAITAPQGLYFSPVVFRVTGVRKGSFLNESLGTHLFGNEFQYIQIDRGGIDVGSSGGPAFNKNGELIGIAVSMYKETGVTFASFLIAVEDIRGWLDKVAPRILK